MKDFLSSLSRHDSVDLSKNGNEDDVDRQAFMIVSKYSNEF